MRTLLLLALVVVGCQSRSPLPLSPDGTLTIDTAKKKPPSPPASGVLDLSRGWQRLGDAALSQSFAAVSFAFPAQPKTQNYLWTESVPSNVTGKTLDVSMASQTSVPAWWFYQPCGGDVPTARLFLHATSTSYMPACFSEDDCWWSNPANVDLTQSSAHLVVPLAPAQWSNTNGHWGTDRPAQFAAALTKTNALGVTFGSCFFGHGIGVSSGAATFSVTHYEVRS